jgi:hypothetical protein
VLPVQDEKGLVRDTNSNAILATDLSEKQKFIIEQKNKKNLNNLEAHIQNVNKLTNEMYVMKEEISEIKTLLKVLINKSKVD